MATDHPTDHPTDEATPIGPAADPLRVVFVGTGAIGLPMALRIRDAGHPLTAVEPGAEARARADAAGLRTGELAATSADVAVVMVATADQLAAVVDTALAAGGVPPAAPVWVLMSTVGPEAVRTQGARLAAAGAAVVDAPVTGGVAGAEAGRLTVFASGAGGARAAAAPVLGCLGVVRDVGDDLGDGQAVKVVNQHLCAVHLVAAAEALRLADALGLDPGEVLGLVAGGAAGSWMLSDRGPRMLAGTDVEVTSAVDIFVKDSGLVAAAAAAAGQPTPLLAAARERFDRAAAAGLGRRDDSRVIETYESSTPQEET